MKNKILITCLLASTLSSCHIYRAYERPDAITVSDSLYRQPVTAEDTTSLASLSWKELFTDPQLQQLIEAGLAHNTDLGIARLKVKEAEALLMTSRLSYLPSVSQTPQGTLTSLDGNKPSKTYNLAVSADWEIDLFGKLLNAKRGAQAALEQSEAYRQAVQTQLVATIANSYYTLLMLDEQLDITRRTADTWTESLRTMKALKRAGQATEMAVAYYATNSARSAFYPSITLSGSAGWTNAAGAAITNPGQWLLSAVGSLVQPLFNRGKNIANLKIAKAQQEEALLTFQQSLLDAGAEVNDALVQWQTARKRIQLDEQQCTSLQSALRSSELLMQYSSQNYLEVITARQALLQAELNTATDRFDEIQGVINLYHALGGGY
ncbi:TolC family protein [Phocaeicola plebeius]|uniref:TolC family protein n=1 Tax=Phocaeicola plebeius TaxID=310297 RepID=UPI0026F313C9|nr:TolC family protein [Phocaeicola plebeius]